MRSDTNATSPVPVAKFADTWTVFLERFWLDWFSTGIFRDAVNAAELALKHSGKKIDGCQIQYLTCVPDVSGVCAG